MKTCQGDRRAGRVWKGLGSKLCSRSWLSVTDEAKGQERQPRDSGNGARDSGPGLSLRATPRGSAGCEDTGPGACGCSGATGRVTAAGPPLTAHVAAPGAAACLAAAAAAASAAAELHTGRENARPARWPRPGSRGPPKARLPTRNQNTPASRGPRVAGRELAPHKINASHSPSQEEDIRLD